MDEVLLRQLKEKVGAEPDVKVDVALSGLRLCDVEIERLVEQLDGLLSLVLLPPADDRFEVCVIRCFCV